MMNVISTAGVASYPLPMSRVAAVQSDLFAPSQSRVVEGPSEPAAPAQDPIAELQALLADLRAASAPPWPDLTTTMAHEYRALGLARQAGPEGEALAAAILDETERLLSAGD